MSELFDDDWGVDDSPADDTEITTTILYYSKEQLTQFKKLCKRGMQGKYTDFHARNFAIFILELLNEKYGDHKAEEAFRGRPLGENIPWE